MWQDHGLTVKSSRLTMIANGIPKSSFADTTHPPRGITPWDRSRFRLFLEVLWSLKSKIRTLEDEHKSSPPCSFFPVGYQRCCSCSPLGGCWSTCWTQSFSSRFLHSRARSCLWWWRIFIPRKTIKAAVSQWLKERTSGTKVLKETILKWFSVKLSVVCKHNTGSSFDFGPFFNV